MTATALTAPVGHLTVPAAAAALNPERTDFWETMPLGTLRDATLAARAAGSATEATYWEILLETRLVRELNMTLLTTDTDGNVVDVDLTTLPL